MVRHLADDYLQIIRVHCHKVSSWSNEFLGCMAHFISFTCRCCWWGGDTIPQLKIIFPTEEIVHEYVQNLMHILVHTPFYQHIEVHRSNDVTTLLETTLMFIIDVIEVQHINWLFRTNVSYQKSLLALAEGSINDVICLAVYHLMGIVLTDEQMKELKMCDRVPEFSFNMLEKAWSLPSKLYKQIPLVYILEGQYHEGSKYLPSRSL
jgi:hypothetical protein